MRVVEGSTSACAQESRSGPGRTRALSRALCAAGAAGAAAALALVPAGCGSSPSTGTSADPARLAPASTRAYIGAVVRPSGDLQSEALAGARALTHQRNPYARVLGMLQTPGSPTLDYGRDVAPWLGPGGGLFFTRLGSSEAALSFFRQGLLPTGSIGWPFSSSGAQGALVLDTSDLAKARAFVAGQATHAGAHAASYRGVTYQAGSGAAFAVIDRLVVIGTEAGMRAAIETSQGGASLQSDATYAQLRTHAPAGELWHLYGNPNIGRRARASASQNELLEVLGGERPFDISLVQAAKSLTLDADLGPAPAGAGAGGPQGSGPQGTTGAGASTSASAGNSGVLGSLATGGQALGELPGEAWLAAGLGDVGQIGAGGTGGLNGLLSLLGTVISGSGSGAGPLAPSSGQATLSVRGLLEGMLIPLRIMSANTSQARRDYRSWMGDAGVFVAGTTVLELKAAAVIDSTDPAASRAAVGKLARALRATGAEATPATVPGTEAAIEAKIAGLPVTLVIADGRAASGKTKFVLGLAQSSIQAALSPPSPISGASAYTAAQSALGAGVQPTALADFSTLLTLLEGVGLSEDPTISPVLPLLRNSTHLYTGGQSLTGGVLRLRIVLDLASTSSG